MKTFPIAFAFSLIALVPLGAQDAQPQAIAGAQQTCEAELLAAGVGSQVRTETLRIPYTRQTSFHLGTPEITLGSSDRGFQMKIPSVTLYDNRTFARYDGSTYRPVVSQTTFLGTTWTDRYATVQGVCVSYGPAIEDLRKNRATQNSTPARPGHQSAGAEERSR